MHLMYTLDEQGTRVYTLKVSSSLLIWRSLISIPQKATQAGKVTKSAHPGMSSFSKTILPLIVGAHTISTLLPGRQIFQIPDKNQA